MCIRDRFLVYLRKKTKCSLWPPGNVLGKKRPVRTMLFLRQSCKTKHVESSMEVKPLSSLIFTFARKTSHPIICQENLSLAPCWVLYTHDRICISTYGNFYDFNYIVEECWKMLAHCTDLHDNSLALLHLYFFLFLYIKKRGACHFNWTWANHNNCKNWIEQISNINNNNIVVNLLLPFYSFSCFNVH